MTGAIVNDCIESVEQLLKSLDDFGSKVFYIYSEDELLDKTKAISLPAMGVVYDGMRSLSESGKDTGKIGVSAEIVVTVIVVFRRENFSTVDPKLKVVQVLDSIRNKFRGVRSPTGHLWRFQLEAAVEGKKGLQSYIQRWSTPVQLV